METKLCNLTMNRLKITFDIQHQGHAARVKLHGKDEFLYASFFHFKAIYRELNAVILTYSYWKWGKEREIQA